MIEIQSSTMDLLEDGEKSTNNVLCIHSQKNQLYRRKIENEDVQKKTENEFSKFLVQDIYRKPFVAKMWLAFSKSTRK